MTVPFEVWTITGRKIDLMDVKPNDISIVDIAWGLSMQNRFNGQVIKPYSVAHHSILVANLVDIPYKLEALMHDAAEAYVGDLIKPIKNHCPIYIRAEKKILKTIFKKYKINDTGEISEKVMWADSVMLHKEKSYFYDGNEVYEDLFCPVDDKMPSPFYFCKRFIYLANRWMLISSAEKAELAQLHKRLGVAGE